MSKIELYYLIEALREWEKVMEEAKAEVDSMRDQIKEEMMAQGTEEMEVGNYIVVLYNCCRVCHTSCSTKNYYGVPATRNFES